VDQEVAFSQILFTVLFKEKRFPKNESSAIIYTLPNLYGTEKEKFGRNLKSTLFYLSI